MPYFWYCLGMERREPSHGLYFWDFVNTVWAEASEQGTARGRRYERGKENQGVDWQQRPTESGKLKNSGFCSHPNF